MREIRVVEADLENEKHRDAVVHLVNAYARDPMGNGRDLPEDVRRTLIPGLRRHPTIFGGVSIMPGCIPPLETARLIIRPFAMGDLDDIHRILDVELHDADIGAEGAKSRDERAQWLQWTILGYEELAKLYQPPYGDRAIVLKEANQVIGACGFVPCLDAFGQIPSLSCAGGRARTQRTSTEFGLFYAMSPEHQRQGYATEAASRMIDYAFRELHVKRVVATTSHDNAPSVRVMRNLGMSIAVNPYPNPPWLQVVGILDNELPGLSVPAVP